MFVQTQQRGCEMRNRKRGGTVTAEMSVIRIVGGEEVDIDIEVSGYFEPEQNGGWDDPSWPANVTFEDAQDMDGNTVVLTKDEIVHAEELMLEAA